MNIGSKTGMTMTGPHPKKPYGNRPWSSKRQTWQGVYCFTCIIKKTSRARKQKVGVSHWNEMSWLFTQFPNLSQFSDLGLPDQRGTQFPWGRSLHTISTYSSDPPYSSPERPITTFKRNFTLINMENPNIYRAIGYKDWDNMNTMQIFVVKEVRRVASGSLNLLYTASSRSCRPERTLEWPRKGEGNC